MEAWSLLTLNNPIKRGFVIVYTLLFLFRDPQVDLVIQVRLYRYHPIQEVDWGQTSSSHGGFLIVCTLFL